MITKVGRRLFTYYLYYCRQRVKVKKNSVAMKIDRDQTLFSFELRGNLSMRAPCSIHEFVFSADSNYGVIRHRRRKSSWEMDGEHANKQILCEYSLDLTFSCVGEFYARTRSDSSSTCNNSLLFHHIMIIFFRMCGWCRSTRISLDN